MGYFSLLRLRSVARTVRPPHTALYAAACLVLAGIAPCATADGPPVVLDTQTGIHDGQSGIVLQNAPLSRAPMVPAQQLQAPTALNSTGGEPPIVVAPYIALPGGNGNSAAPAAGNGYGYGYGNRMLPRNRQ